MCITIISRFFKYGFEIDQTNNKYRFISISFGLTSGKWKELPPVKYISVVRVLETTKGFQPSSAMPVEQHKGEKAFNLNLIVDDSSRYITLYKLKKDIALKTALEIGNMFNYKVLDVTTQEKIWIRE